MATGKITQRQIETCKPGEWLAESLGHGNGSFLARRTPAGISYYFRYNHQGKRETVPLEASKPDMTLKDWRDVAKAYATLAKEHPELRQWLELQTKLETERTRRELHEREHSTLGALLDGYVVYLERQGKASARLVKASLKKDVVEAFPGLAASKAAAVTRGELTQVVSKLVSEGKGRQGAKLRAYIRAAYAAAIKAGGDPTIPPELHGFNIETNPAADMAALSQFNRARDTALSEPELRAAWQKMQALNGVTGAALRLCLLLGGQRPTQLLRLKSNDVDLHDGLITLHDGKGRRTTPRRHTLPMSEAARAELEPYMALHGEGYVLSSTGGRVPLTPETLSNAFRELVAKPMLEAGEIRQDIRLSDLRRTVETRLASMKVSKETRAHLQSHGLNGVQDRHYDKYSYLPEKQHALTVLEDILEGRRTSAGKVINFAKKRA